MNPTASAAPDGSGRGEDLELARREFDCAFRHFLQLIGRVAGAQPPRVAATHARPSADAPASSPVGE